ncbi:BppU family phage baseplate upper protein [Lactococcus garvieae]|uniref:BppU family phage baseplate upper protein n=1 Tax=Lactococcus garvieae TaxID=1363 RepID=UPI00398E67B3
MQERLKLDLYQKTSVSQGITTRVNDGGQHEIQATALAYGDVFDLTGWKIKFELTTSAKTISIDAVNAKITAAKEGEFSYIIPKEITGAAGNAERAYFAFENGDKRITSADINMTILQIVDITAEEARSYIAEYNKLVEELHEITDEYVSDSDAKFADINKKITSLQSQITEYQANVKKTADDAVSAIDSSVSTAVSTVNSSSNAAIKAVDDALKQFEAGDFYTKSESDAKFKLTINDSGAIAAGTDLNSINISGFYAVSNKKPDTEILNYPKGVKLSGSGSIYAQVVVFKNASSTMIKQVFYDQLSTREYYRSFANNAWQEWQLAAIDSEVVHLTGDETIGGKKTFTEDLKANSLEVSGDLPKGALAAKTGFAINGSPWYRVKNGLLQISCTGLSITANVPTGGWKDVCSLTGADSINSTGDATTVIMNGNNSSYIGARVRVVNGVLRILPEAAVAPTQYMNDFITIAID